MSGSFDGRDFRRILGHYPTGVCAVTAMLENRPIGMVVGSFTSVSLDPPLVAFLPDRRSTSWRAIEAAAGFCVNVLAADQEHICRALVSGGDRKFEAIAFRPSPRGSPILDGVISWIDCDLHAVHEAGDHFIVIGRVHALEVEHPREPLLFCMGDYGQFAPIARAMG